MFQLVSAQIGRDEIWLWHLFAVRLVNAYTLGIYSRYQQRNLPLGQQKRSPVSVWQVYCVGQHPLPLEPQVEVPSGHVEAESAQPP